MYNFPDNKIHGANMGPTWVLSAPDGPHVGPMNLAIGGDRRRQPGGTFVNMALHRNNQEAEWDILKKPSSSVNARTCASKCKSNGGITVAAVDLWVLDLWVNMVLIDSSSSECQLINYQNEIAIGMVIWQKDIRLIMAVCFI